MFELTSLRNSRAAETRGLGGLREASRGPKPPTEHRITYDQERYVCDLSTTKKLNLHTHDKKMLFESPTLSRARNQAGISILKQILMPSEVHAIRP